MRAMLILTAALSLAACDVRYADDPSDEEMEAWEAERAATGGGEAAELGDAPAASGGTVGGRDASCGGMADAERFVRCLYAGIGEGWLNTREAPDGPAVFTDGVWTQTEEMRRLAPNWERIEMLCLCETPTQVRLRSVTITPGEGGTAVAQVEISGSANERPRLDLVLEDGGWQVNDVRHDM